MNPPHPIQRRATLVVVAMTVLGAALRLWSFPHLGLEHFDEGIYALGGLWAVRSGGLATLDPSLIPYAPPGLPTLIGLSYKASFPWPGVSDLAAILPSLVCGIATIPAAAWIARRTFGPAAGAAAAAFCALSGPHVAFSRMALTDVPFLFAWIVALALGGRFLERPGLGRAVVFGAAVGLAQNVKYNGWLAGVIVAVTAALGLFSGAVEVRARSRRAIGFGLAASVVATLVYLPWYRFVEEHGGYASLLRHHRSYLGGPETWWSHWKSQMAQSVALSGLLAGRMTWGGAAWALGFGGWAWVRARRPVLPGRWGGMLLRAVLLGGVAALGMMPNLPWWIALVMAPWLLRDDRPAVRLLGVGWCLMALLTPYYHPYARLWLPLHAFGWIAVAGLIAEGTPRLATEEGEDAPLPRISLRGVSVLLAMGLCALQQFAPADRPVPLPNLLGPSDSLRRAAETIGKRRGDPVHVLGRPSLTFYLATSHGIPVATHGSWDELLRVPQPATVVLDELLLRQERSIPAVRDLLNSPPGDELLDRINAPTLLDVDPGAASRRTDLGRADGGSTIRSYGAGEPQRRPTARIFFRTDWVSEARRHRTSGTTASPTTPASGR